MTPEEIRELAARIAEIIRGEAWVPGPVRPEPPSGPVPGNLPPWAGAAQTLGDVAPSHGKPSHPGRHRPAYDALVAATRGAAAGRAPAPLAGGRGGHRPIQKSGVSVPVAVSNHHIHATQAVVDQLFGVGHRLTSERAIKQPNQFAAAERVTVSGPKGRIEGIRIVGPPRDRTQIELSLSDCRVLGIDAPVRNSGDITDSSAISLSGPAGSFELPEGVIVAARHLHVGPEDEERLGLLDGDRVTLELGSGDRSVTLHDVLVRAGPTHATELHVDADEARAFGVTLDSTAHIVGRPRRGMTRSERRGTRTLVTERDVPALAAAGLTLTDGGTQIVTPAAKDRAKALGIWRGA